jgi:NMD protein affecting ribosome stability and mRNA decay
MNPKKLRSSTQRKSMDTSGDPYLLKEEIYDMAVCKSCCAIYHNKRWYLDGDLYQKMIKLKSTFKTLCPACLKIKDKFPGGIVRLKGVFLKDHKEEILNLIKNEEQRARGFNPLERVIEINEFEEGMEITTTNEKLAQRIGKSLQRAYHGKVDYKWTHDTKLLRVEWER